ncbi:MAG: hypothetical protein WCV58_02790 [Patescibacteria group bacterium]|jgi:hypothetical protein
MKVTKIKKVLSYTVFIAGFVLLLFALTQIPIVQQKTFVGRYQKAYNYYKLAKTYPVGSAEYSKFMAISSALLHNQKSFSLGSMGQIPVQPFAQ